MFVKLLLYSYMKKEQFFWKHKVMCYIDVWKCLGISEMWKHILTIHVRNVY